MLLDVLDLERRAREGGAAHHALAEPHAGSLERGSEFVGSWSAGAQLEDTGRAIVLVDDAAIGLSEAGGVGDDGGKDGGQVERGGDGLPDFAQNVQLVHGAGQLGGALLQLLEEPGVLDGDDGLIREGLQQRDLFAR